MYDEETLNNYSTPRWLRFPWMTSIYMFNSRRGTGIIISNRHILAAASRLLPYRGTPNENFKSSLSSHYDDSLEPNFW